MPNMSYCRFHNTALNLRDCLIALDPDENEYEISTDEVKCGQEMFRKFLEYCVDNDIIEKYNEEMIKEVFEKHNIAVQEDQNMDLGM